MDLERGRRLDRLGEAAAAAAAAAAADVETTCHGTKPNELRAKSDCVETRWETWLHSRSAEASAFRGLSEWETDRGIRRAAMKPEANYL